MARPKRLVDEATLKIAESALERIQESKLVLQLKAVIAVRDHPVHQVAEILQVSPRSIFRWIHRLQQGGIEALCDKPKGHRKSKLTPDQLAEIERWVLEGRTAQGQPILWTVPKLQEATQREFGVSLSKTPMWLHLKKRGLAPRRPRHAKADPEAQSGLRNSTIDSPVQKGLSLYHNFS